MKRIEKIPQFQTIEELNNFLSSEQYEYGLDGMTIEILLEEYGRVIEFYWAVNSLTEKMQTASCE